MYTLHTDVGPPCFRYVSCLRALPPPLPPDFRDRRGGLDWLGLGFEGGSMTTTAAAAASNVNCVDGGGWEGFFLGGGGGRERCSSAGSEGYTGTRTIDSCKRPPAPPPRPRLATACKRQTHTHTSRRHTPSHNTHKHTPVRAVAAETTAADTPAPPPPPLSPPPSRTYIYMQIQSSIMKICTYVSIGGAACGRSATGFRLRMYVLPVVCMLYAVCRCVCRVYVGVNGVCM